MSSSSLPRAETRKTIHLPAWPDVGVIIRRVSVRMIGLDAGLRIVSNFESVGLAAANTEEANKELQVATAIETPQGQIPKAPRSPTQPFAPEREDTMPTEMKQLIMREAERSIVKKGLVWPSWEEMCAAFDADPENPEEEMADSWDALVAAIMEFSGEQSMGHVGLRGSPEEVERFPGDARLNAERDGKAVGQNTSRTRKRKRR